MANSTMNLELRDLITFCDGLPAPIIARPVWIIGRRGRDAHLALDTGDTRAVVTEDGKPCTFASINAIMYELSAAPNVDHDQLAVDVSRYYLD